MKWPRIQLYCIGVFIWAFGFYCRSFTKWEENGQETYGFMKFEKGQNCWNGPDRSATVSKQSISGRFSLSAAT